MSMTSIERMQAFLHRQKMDRIPVYEHFWNDTHKGWVEKGYVKPEDDFVELFDFDMDECWAFNYTADLDFEPKVIEENEDTVVMLDGNGATLRRHKFHDTTPEHVGFTVTDREGWESITKPLLTPDPRRINFDAYRAVKQRCAKANRFFCWSGINVFECMHPVCGHENMLVGMALDPAWIEDMANTYAELNIHLMETLFAQEGKPDGIWFYEDMGFKERPFMSPAMYEELILPAHKKTIDYAKSLGLPVIMHSCGCVEKLIPGILEAGVDCLQVIEVKAGMDLLKLYKLYGDRLSFMGGMDVRKLYTNDIAQVEEELVSKIPTVMQGFGYALHSDHSIPVTVDRPTFDYFIQRGRELGTY